jgi:hypothetical protein
MRFRLHPDIKEFQRFKLAYSPGHLLYAVRYSTCKEIEWLVG